jgi:hypothetical protein
LATLSAKIHAVAHLAFFGWLGSVAVASCAMWCLRGPSVFRRVVAIWWLIAVAAVTAWMPFPWLRYVAPLILPSVLVVAFAASDAVRLVSRFKSPAGNQPSAAST